MWRSRSAISKSVVLMVCQKKAANSSGAGASVEVGMEIWYSNVNLEPKQHVT